MRSVPEQEAAVATVSSVSSRLEVTVTRPADIVFSVAVSAGHKPLDESLRMSVDGKHLEYHEVLAAGRARLHRARDIPAGAFVLEYSAKVDAPGEPAPHTEADEILYGRPSRYCDSDRLFQVALSTFPDLTGLELVKAIREWVKTKVLYMPGSSRVVDGALETYLSRRGVCRDFAHLVVTFCRAKGIPARLVSVYAPGLVPMDFHAVAEVCVDGSWYVVDATGLAPRASMVRIATGRDASDTAFMTTMSGRTQLKKITVSAVAEGVLPVDNPEELVQIS